MLSCFPIFGKKIKHTKLCRLSDFDSFEFKRERRVTWKWKKNTSVNNNKFNFQHWHFLYFCKTLRPVPAFMPARYSLRRRRRLAAVLLLQVTAASETAAVGAAETTAETAVATAGRRREEELVLDHRGAGGGRKLEVVGLHGAVDKSDFFCGKTECGWWTEEGKRTTEIEREKER